MYTTSLCCSHSRKCFYHASTFKIHLTFQAHSPLCCDSSRVCSMLFMSCFIIIRTFSFVVCINSCLKLNWFFPLQHSIEFPWRARKKWIIGNSRASTPQNRLINKLNVKWDQIFFRCPYKQTNLVLCKMFRYHFIINLQPITKFN